MKVFLLAVLVLSFRLVTAQNEAEIEKVAKQVLLNTTMNMGDFNALNENYIDYKSAIDVFDNLTEGMNGVPMGFVLQSYATSTLEFENPISMFVLQVIISAFDIEESVNMGAANITVDTSSTFPLLVLPNGMSGTVCVFNAIWKPESYDAWVRCSPSRQKVIEEGTWALNWIDDVPTPERVLTTEFSKNFMRFDLRFTSETEKLNSTTQTEILDIYKRGLEVSSYGALKTAYFAYLNMVQQQTLDSIDLKNIESPLLLNLLLVNDQIHHMQEQLSYLPNYVPDFGNMSVLETRSSANIRGAITSACEAAVLDSFKVSYIKDDTIYPRWCVAENGGKDGCERKAKTGKFQYEGGTNTLWDMSTTLQFDTFSSAVSFQFQLTPEFQLTQPATLTDYNNDINVTVSTPIWQINFLPKLTSTTVFLQTPSLSPVRIVDSNIRIQLKLSEPFKMVLTLQDPIAVNFEINGQTIYGVQFNILSEEVSDQLFTYYGVDSEKLQYRPTDISCDSIVGNDIRFKPEIQHLSGGGESWWADCHSIDDGPITLEAPIGTIDITQLPETYNYTFSASSQFLGTWLVYETSPSSVISYSTTDTLIQQQLQQLATKVQSLDDRVTRLEDASTGQLAMILNFVDIFATVFDLSLNLADKISYFTMATKVAKDSLHDLEDRAGFATELSTMLKEERRNSHYDPLEAINNAGIFSYQHGLAKQEWRNEELAGTEIVDIETDIIRRNSLDIREASITNPTLYMKMQKELGETAKWGPEFAGGLHGVGQVTALSSPIEELPVIGKVLHDVSSDSEGARSFLSNQYQRFPFHTSVSTRTFDIEEEGTIVLNSRFAGVAEPSIIGPTNAKSPRIKIGYIKFQHDYLEDGTLEMRNWDKTFIIPGRTYTEEEVDQLYFSFTGLENSFISADEKWELLAFFTNRRVNSRNAIDSVPLPSSIFLESLDDLMFFDKTSNRFKYDLFNNNCQTFVKVFSQLATNGYSQLALSATDFAEFARIFEETSRSYLHPPYTIQVMDTLDAPSALLKKMRASFSQMDNHYLYGNATYGFPI